MKLDRVAPVNELGLAIPPVPNVYSGYGARKNRPDGVNRHHLYWPKNLYVAHSALAKRFRDHRFNSVWMLESDHNDLNHAYDGVPVPDQDVMRVFMAEAMLLDDLNVTVRAVEMIDKAIYEGRVKRLGKVMESRQGKLGILEGFVEKALDLEVVRSEIVSPTVNRALELATAA